MAICDRCGSEFNYMDELRNERMDIYIKVKDRDINNKAIKKWKHIYLCPKCDDDMWRFYEFSVKIL